MVTALLRKSILPRECRTQIQVFGSTTWAPREVKGLKSAPNQTKTRAVGGMMVVKKPW